ncbi:unnamed protein product, partial [Durusdinium trenchii]
MRFLELMETIVEPQVVLRFARSPWRSMLVSKGFGTTPMQQNHPWSEWWQNKKALGDLAGGYIDETRVKIAKEFGVDFMILSITGGTQDMKNTSDHFSVEKFQGLNREFLTKIQEANHMEQKPRLAGFCLLPLWDPQA